MATNVNRNFNEVSMGAAVWDWFVVIDNTSTYLYPENADYLVLLLRKAQQSLVESGRILLDFINYAKRDNDFEYRQWLPFQQTDLYAYGLYSHRMSDGINRSESIFIRRAGGESRKLELNKGNYSG